jgi:arylsulfatase A-like enzyme
MRILPLLLLSLLSFSALAAAPARQPNIVVILSDDQGYADVSFNPQHPKEVATPNIDALARGGVICTQAYISGNVCSPTRAGLMTGRYQQRVGIYTAGEGGSGLPLGEKIFPEYLKPAGYVTGAFGKWHLGLTKEYNPASRGFDEFYGFLGRGAHPYFDLAVPDHPIYRGVEPIEDKGYLTTRLTDEAVGFIQRHKARPFYIHLAYNAVHAPAEAPEEDIKQFNTGDKLRDTLMAMLKHLDLGVGRVVDTLKKEGLFENTLVIFLTDNGGSKAMNANNTPLRGFKQQNYEGGIRTPFIASWPAQLKAGTKCDVPVVSLDLLPTALAAAGVSTQPEKRFDGKNILPALKGDTTPLHPNLFWSEGGESGEWAVRSGNWKLVANAQRSELFDLAADPSEKTDLAKQQPGKVKELTALYDAWLDEMADPLSGAPKRKGGEASGKAKKRQDAGGKKGKKKAAP